MQYGKYHTRYLQEVCVIRGKISSARDLLLVIVLVIVSRVFDSDYDFLVVASPTLFRTPYSILHTAYSLLLTACFSSNVLKTSRSSSAFTENIEPGGKIGHTISNKNHMNASSKTY